MVGGSAALAAALVAWSPGDGGAASLLAGGLLLGFLSGEMLLLRGAGWSWTEFVYFVPGGAMALLGAHLARPG